MTDYTEKKKMGNMQQKSMHGSEEGMLDLLSVSYFSKLKRLLEYDVFTPQIINKILKH